MVSLEALVLATALAASGDAVLLDFTASWCGPCRSMDPVVRRLMEDGYSVQRIDVEQHPEYAQRFGVGPIPCFVLLVNGREVDRVVGATSYDRLVQMFRKAQAGGDDGRRPVVRAQSPKASPLSRILPRRLRRLGGSTQSTSTPPPELQGPRQREGHAAQGNPPQGSATHQRALFATVRLRVSDPDGHSYATGTIIDTHGEEALVVTCGHVFRDSQGKGQISVDLFAPGATSSVAGQLIAYDADDRDIGLVAIRPGVRIEPVPVASTAAGVAPGRPVFSIGCDRGGEPRLLTSNITHVNRYLGAPNIEVAGQPVDGRSGGGLFTAEGQLIGVCNAADPADDEGIYAALSTIHWQLDQINQTRIYQQEDDAVAQLAGEPTRPSPRDSQGPQHRAPPAPQPLDVAPLEGDYDYDDTEMICILRSKRNPQGTGQLIVLEQPSRDLLQRLARESGQPQRFALQAEPADASVGPSDPSRLQDQGPVVRGQSQQ